VLKEPKKLDHTDPLLNRFGICNWHPKYSIQFRIATIGLYELLKQSEQTQSFFRSTFSFYQRRMHFFFENL